MNLDESMVCNPDLGCGLVAGYGLSGAASDRPGFGWFFGGDASINSFAMSGAGQVGARARRRAALLREVPARRRQDHARDLAGRGARGLVQLSVSRTITATPRRSGSSRSASTGGRPATPRSCASSGPTSSAPTRGRSRRTTNGDGLMENPSAGAGALEVGDLQIGILSDIYLSGVWVAALDRFARMAEATGEPALAAQARAGPREGAGDHRGEALDAGARSSTRSRCCRTARSTRTSRRGRRRRWRSACSTATHGAEMAAKLASSSDPHRLGRAAAERRQRAVRPAALQQRRGLALRHRIRVARRVQLPQRAGRAGSRSTRSRAPDSITRSAATRRCSRAASTSRSTPRCRSSSSRRRWCSRRSSADCSASTSTRRAHRVTIAPHLPPGLGFGGGGQRAGGSRAPLVRACAARAARIALALHRAGGTRTPRRGVLAGASARRTRHDVARGDAAHTRATCTRRCTRRCRGVSGSRSS